LFDQIIWCQNQQLAGRVNKSIVWNVPGWYPYTTSIPETTYTTNTTLYSRRHKIAMWKITANHQMKVTNWSDTHQKAKPTNTHNRNINVNTQGINFKVAGDWIGRSIKEGPNNVP